MSNITNTASVNTTEARIAAIDVPANSTFVADQVTAVVQPSATSVKTAKANLAYEYVEQKADDGSLHVSYKPVALSPAKYERHQTLESVVVEADVIVPLSRIEYVEQYRKAEEVTARETLSMCRLVYEANKSLNSAEFATFCEEIGYKDYSSVIRKFIVIGKIQPRLIAYADRLPASWSSIYSLTQIPAQVFENMIEMKRSFKEMTVSAINKLVKETRDLNNLDDIIKPALLTSEEKSDKVLGATVVASIYFTKMPDDLDWHAFEKAMMEVQANLPVRVQLPAWLIAAYNNRKDKRYKQLKATHAPNPFKPESWDMGREVSAMSQTALNDVVEQKAA